MPAPLRIILNPEEERTLSELRVATSVPQRTKDRAHMLRLNAQGWQVAQIARCFECHEHTVRATIHRWESKGLSGLWEKAGRGMPARWQESDLAFLETCLEQDPRTYNSAQLSQKLKEERKVNLSPDRLRRVLKKRAMSGSELDIPTEASKTLTKKPSNKQTLRPWSNGL
jgi:transposase